MTSRIRTHAAVAAIASAVLQLAATAALAATYHVDCRAGSAAAAATSAAAAWKTVDRVSAMVFAPGDAVLFRCRTRCDGMLSPQGSGTDARPIRIGSYGDGARPVVDGIPGAAIDDVVIDGVVAHHTTQWAGVIVIGTSRQQRARHVTVRNTVVHDLFGDGIVRYQVEEGLIEKSAAWLTGLQPKETIGTPNGIWTWRCRRCIVHLTEGFYIDPRADLGLTLRHVLGPPRGSGAPVP